MFINILRKFKRLFLPFEAKENKLVLFYRNFQGFQGGHLKTWNYYSYLKDMDGFYPQIFFSKTSTWNENPWKGNCNPNKRWDPGSADILFLAGLDWSALEGLELDENKPVINLIQAIRHADKTDIRYKYLRNKAIRICVGNEIASAIKATNIVNGPVFTILNGIDLNLVRQIVSTITCKKLDVFISGLKNKYLAAQLNIGLEKIGLRIDIQIDSIPREEYLRKIAKAKISLLLPAKTEGFYLPALESMALESFTICPDCVGNRSFCVNTHNCYMPEYNYNSIFQVVIDALNLPDDKYKKILKNATSTVEEHSLLNEKRKFKSIMSNVDKIWSLNE